MSQFAKQTNVEAGTTRGHIEDLLYKYGAESFAYEVREERATVQFEIADRVIRFTMELPQREDVARTETGKPRRPEVIVAALRQAHRQKWRCLFLVIKAKLEAAASGIATLEEEFLPYTVLPGGRTVFETIGPPVAAACLDGEVAPRLADLRGAPPT